MPRTGLSPAMVVHSRTFRYSKSCSLRVIKDSLVLQPRPDESGRFGLGPRSLAATWGVAVAFLS